MIWTIIMLIINNNLKLNSIINSVLYPDSGLWFLWVLFIINVVFVFGTWFAERLKIKEGYIIVAIGLLLAGIMVAFDFRLLGFQFIAYYYLFYSMGYFLNKYNDRLVTKKKNVIVLLSLVWLALAWFWNMHELPNFLKVIPIPLIIMQYFYRFVTAALAIYLLIAFMPQFLDNEKRWNKPLEHFGKISLGIYTVHYLLMGKIVWVYSSLGLSNPLIIISSFITGLLVSWLIVWLISEWNVTSTWLLGKV